MKAAEGADGLFIGVPAAGEPLQGICRLKGPCYRTIRTDTSECDSGQGGAAFKIRKWTTYYGLVEKYGHDQALAFAKNAEARQQKQAAPEPAGAIHRKKLVYRS